MSKLVCHRGASKFAPENTIPAFEKAVEIGADGVEFDVHLTKDNHLVVCHNYTINETSNGRGIIEKMTLEELKNLDFGIKFSDEFKGVTIPTLEEVVQVVKGMNFINIEIKAESSRNEELAQILIDEMKKYDINDKVIYSSFDHDVLKTLKSLDDSLKIGALFNVRECVSDKQFSNNLKLVLENGFQAIHPYALCSKEEYIKSCHQNGVLFNSWGATSQSKIKKLMDYNCDVIITDEIVLAMELNKK